MNRRVKVFYIINSLALGGAERQMAELVRRLPRDRYEPVLCSLAPPNAYAHLLPDDQPRYQARAKTRAGVLFQVAGWLRRERPDIVHCFMEWSNLAGRLLAGLAGNPIVITSVRSRMMRPDYALLEWLLARRSHVVVVNSVGTRNELVHIQRVPADKIAVIGNIIDFERFAPAAAAERRRARERFGLTGPSFVLPGRISISKHQLGLVQAVARLHRRGQLPRQTKFLLAGRVYNGSVGWALQALIRWHGLQRYFVLPGAVSGARALYAAADWVLLPSLYEGLPNAAIEAHACARPLLLSRAANLDGIMVDGQTGYQFATGSIDALTQALQRALETPAEQAALMGRRGRQWVLEKFDPQQALAQVTDLYDSLLRRHRGRSS